MEITASSFYHLLPEILSRLSDCCFVALDLEFSGVPISPRKSNEIQSLQERYEELKQCADKYQVLQVGLTIGHEDAEKRRYILRPYNLYLNPIVDSGLGLQRDFTLQSNAMRFLFKQNFSMNSVFDRGVGYLSLEEVSRAVAEVAQKGGLPETPQTLKVDDSNPESVAFLNTVRALVSQWVGHSDTQPRDKYLNIPPPWSSTDLAESSPMPGELSRHQKKLVHGLIETEYPYLTASSMGLFIQIFQRDEKREAVQDANRMLERNQRIRKSKGFGWVAEALVGGDLSDLDPSCFQRDMLVGRSLARVKKAADAVKQKLHTNQFLVVGHNLFVDLVYFCRCFVGPLPDSVVDFQVMARRLFPRVIDTKYLATHGCGDLNPPSSLGKVSQDLLHIGAPMIVLHDNYRKYRREPAEHEAGYDSLLTAQVFLKLSVQLRDTVPRITPEELNHMAATSLRMDEFFGAEPPSQSSQLTNCSDAHAKVDKGGLIPRRGAPFWEHYGNRLRAFGTRERMCFLG